MIRVFDYLNISNAKNVLADSGFHVQRNFINYAMRKRNDLFFYLTIPAGQESKLVSWFENPERVKFIPLHYTTAGSLNKLLIDIKSLRKNFPWRRYVVTVIWNNEVYAAPIVMQTFKATFPFNRVSLANYVHWLEIPEQNRLGTPYEGNWLLWMMANSIYWSTKTYFNSFYGIDLVLSYFPKFCRGDIYDKIKEKVQPLYLGINVEELDKFKTDETFDKPTFIFNQRIVHYTGAREVLKAATQLVDEGYDFYFIVTNPSQSSIKTVDYANPKYKKNIIRYQAGLPWKDYIRTLWKADAVVAWHGGTVGQNSPKDSPLNQWSLAFPEAIACGCYPIAHSNGFFPEMLPREYLIPTKSYDSLLSSMRYVIDNVQEIRSKAKAVQSYVREKYDWRVQIDSWVKALEFLHETTAHNFSGLTAKTTRRIVEVIQRRGVFRWSDLSGKYIVWSGQCRTNRIAPYFWLCENYEESPTDEPVFSKREIEKWL